MTKITERADDDDDVEVGTIIHYPLKKSKQIIEIDLCDSSDDDDGQSKKPELSCRTESNEDKNVMEIPSLKKNNHDEIITNTINGPTEKSLTIDPHHAETSSTTTTTNSTTVPSTAIPSVESITRTRDVTTTIPISSSSNQTSNFEDHKDKQQDEVSDGRLNPSRLDPVELDLLNFLKELDSEAKIGFDDQDLLALGQQLTPTKTGHKNVIGGQEQAGPSSGIKSRKIKGSSTKSPRKRKILQKSNPFSPSSKSLSPHLRRLFVERKSGDVSTVSKGVDVEEISETSDSMDVGGIGSKSGDKQTEEQLQKLDDISTLPTGIIIFYPQLWDETKRQELLQFLKIVKTRCHVRLRPQISKDKSNVKISIRSSSVDSINAAKRIITRWLDPKYTVKDNTKWVKENRKSHDQQLVVSHSNTSTGPDLVVEELSSSSNNYDTLNRQTAVECWSQPLPPEYWNYVLRTDDNGRELGWEWLSQNQLEESMSENFIDRIMAIVDKYDGSLKKHKLGNTIRFAISGPSTERIRIAKNEIDHCIMSMDKDSELKRERERLQTIEDLEREVAELEREKRRLEWEASQLD